MKSKMIKLSTAAAILIIVGIISLSPNGPKIVTPAFAMEEIIAAMKSVPWMHQTSRGFERGVTGVGEQWFGFEDKIHITKTAIGKMTFMDLKNHKRSEYDPETNIITVHYVVEDDFPLNLTSPWTLIESMSRSFKELGAETTITEGVYDGHDVQIQAFVLSDAAGKHESQKVILYIDSKSKLLIGAQVQGHDAEDNVVMDGEIIFRYPEMGPADIYALGVPQDASVVDLRPVLEFQAIWEAYRSARKAAPQEYILIATEARPARYGAGDAIRYYFKKDWQYRNESHSRAYKAVEPSLPKTIVSYQNLMQLWREGGLRKKSDLYLYDGNHKYWFDWNDEQQWEIRLKNYHPKEARNRFEIPRTHSLGYYAWPNINRKLTLYEDDYSKQNNLICVENLQQAMVHNGHATLPGRFLYYLDPEHDYICRRKVVEWRPDASWQEDLEWDKEVDPDQVQDGSIRVTDVTEYDQADSGHWYPKTIEIRSSGVRKDYQEVTLELKKTITIYLKVNPDFPEGTFDAAQILSVP